ncbi:MAG: hypothetical protein HYZ44_16145 [Bacteroidetes bacterium]|nr:hypothetical protein [Bacteroidota bacterium]
MMRGVIVLQIGFLLFSTLTYSQSPKSDTSFLTTSITNAKEIYTNAIRGQERVLNGSEYLEYQPTGKEHPYYLSNEWSEGNIEYDGQVFTNISFRYNTHTDEIIIEQESPYRMIQLVKSKVLHFTLNGHRFKSLYSKSLPLGYYDCLIEGDVCLYAKRVKELKETTSSGKVVREFTEKTRFLVKKNDIYYFITGKKALIKILSDHSQELTSFIRSERLRFKKSKIEASLVKAVDFYLKLK